jgi:serine phosphatase RsbU (regulator of sigma subunit)
MSESTQPSDRAVLTALRSMLRMSHVSGADGLPLLAQTVAGHLGAHVGRLYLIDYDQVLLIPLLAPGEDAHPQPVRVEGTLAGRAFADVVQQVSRADGRLTLWSPLLDGNERLGVLRLEFPSQAQPDDERLAACRDVASVLAELVLTRSLYGDLIERTRRRRGLTLPAEIQWRLLPPLTFVSERASVAGVMAPAEEVAGDSFDYAVDGDFARVAIFDAMGHGLEAALLAALAISTLRNARRSGAELAATVRAVDDAISSHFGPEKFVTGIIGELDVIGGRWNWIACGHPPALLVRGGRVVKTLDNAVGPPLGFRQLLSESAVGHERLEPGDRLLLYTDGVVEARDANGAFFGSDRLAEFVSHEAVAGRPVAETLRRLNLAILAHQEGRLQDDATTVVVEWLAAESSRSALTQ